MVNGYIVLHLDLISENYFVRFPNLSVFAFNLQSSQQISFLYFKIGFILIVMNIIRYFFHCQHWYDPYNEFCVRSHENT